MRKNLTPIEAKFFALFAQVVGHGAVIGRLKGEISLDQLKGALEKVCRKHWLLATRVVTADDGAWYETEGVGEIPLHTFVGEWTEKITEELSRPFDNKTGALTRVLLGSSGDFTDLIVIVKQNVVDGLSVVYILRDILHYLAHPDEAVTPLPVAPPLEELLPPIDYAQIESDFLAPPEKESRPEVERQPREQAPQYVLAWSLTETRTNALVKRCRQEGVTAHATLCTAFLNAYARLDQTGSTVRSVASPINIRDRLLQPVGEQVGSFVNHQGVRIYLDCKPGRDFWEMAREVKASLLNSMSDENILIPIYRFHKMLQSAPILSGTDSINIPRHVEYDLSLSNFGRFDFPVTYPTLQLDSIYSVSNSMRDETRVVAATAAGKLTFTLASRPNVLTRSAAETIRADVNQRLERVAPSL